MCEWGELSDRIAAANNAAMTRITSEGRDLNAYAAEDECAFAATDAWLAAVGFDDAEEEAEEAKKSAAASRPSSTLAARAVERYGDVYNAVWRKFDAACPAALRKSFLPFPPASDDESSDAAARDARRYPEYPTPAELGALAYVSAENAGPRGGVLAFDAEFSGVSARALWYQPVDALKRVFSFAVPNPEALDAIAALDAPVVEMGAGTGYWAALLQQRGVRVTAMDARPPSDSEDPAVANEFHTHSRFAEVVEGSPSDLDAYDDAALFLCWPVKPGHGDQAWDAECLDHWRGRFLVHVGEWRRAKEGEGERRRGGGGGAFAPSVAETFPRGTAAADHPAGLTTSAAFQERVEREFTLRKHVRIPNWPHARDDLTIWERKG